MSAFLEHFNFETPPRISEWPDNYQQEFYYHCAENAIHHDDAPDHADAWIVKRVVDGWRWEREDVLRRALSDPDLHRRITALQSEGFEVSLDFSRDELAISWTVGQHVHRHAARALGLLRANYNMELMWLTQHVKKLIHDGLPGPTPMGEVG